ncbi:DUF317 domain-containing protein [Kitasatospora sp. NRRL B-11411]|uniref:DUF317 domain-containing protein n=1 Tax=Kitasatospora sp. NRRL B-11411 TaxID=1463822 RepID=UPI0004C3EF3D|nr:DUF317 domain-containing protein [Kitasatospora sp. NRRL B-11411]
MNPDTPVRVAPGHLAGPGNAEAALEDFFESCPTWSRWRPYDETTLALHERLTAVIELDHETTENPRWTIASYQSPVDELAWQATFCTRTPVEIVMAVAHRLTAALDSPSRLAGEDLLWGGHSYEDAVRHAVEGADVPWEQAVDSRQWRRADGTAAITPASHDPWAPGPAESVTTLSGGPSGSDREQHWWTATFTQHTPTALIIAALDEVVEPLPADREFGQVSEANRAHVHIEARRSRAASATSGGGVPVIGAAVPGTALAYTPTDPARRSR